MADDTQGQAPAQTATEDPAPVKTAADLKIEALEKRLDDLEKLNAELREANAGLWAAAHPAPAPAQDPAPAQAAAGPSDIETLYRSLGIKE